MKIALIKQDCYDDLYICKNNTPIEEMFLSTLMRTGPIGLFDKEFENIFSTDYFIIKEQKENECKSYKKSTSPLSKKLKYQLQNLPGNKIDADSFNFKIVLSDKSHKDFAINPNDVDWNNYDVVISINVAIPTKIVKKYENTLWCYMYGEANSETPYPKFGYDVLITQDIMGTVPAHLGKADFPYTFCGTHTLENIAKKLFPLTTRGEVQKTGIYAEINNTTERPVTKVPCLEFAKELGHEVIFHSQNIKENLERLYKAKYFVKLQGRVIRGNSVIEAVSAGTLVLMNPKDLMHSQILPKECWIHDKKEASELIKKLDSNPLLYEEYLQKERELIQRYVIDAPIESLKTCLKYKREGQKVFKPTLRNRIRLLINLLS